MLKLKFDLAFYRPSPQDPPTDDYYGSYGQEGQEYYNGDYDEAESYVTGTGAEYEAEPPPDENDYGSPAPEDTGKPEAATYGRNRNNDPCAGVVCPELDCPTRPYIPQGKCCPECPGGGSSRQSQLEVHLYSLLFVNIDFLHHLMNLLIRKTITNLRVKYQLMPTALQVLRAIQGEEENKEGQEIMECLEIQAIQVSLVIPVRRVLSQTFSLS